MDKLIAYTEEVKNEGTGVAPIIPDVMEMLYWADRFLATVAISESARDANVVSEANKLVAEGDDYWDTGDPGTQADNTFDKLEEGWEKATNC